MMKRNERFRGLPLLPLLLIALLALGVLPGRALAGQGDEAGTAGAAQLARSDEPAFEPGEDEPYPDRAWGRRGEPGGFGHGPRGHRGPGPGRMAPGGPGPEGQHMALRQLDLSESQRADVRAIFEGGREQAMANHETMAALGEDLERQIETDPFDEEAVRAKAAAVAELRVEMAVLRARQMGQIRQLLTPEQLDRLEEMKAERQSFRQERRERFERRRGPGIGS